MYIRFDSAQVSECLTTSLKTTARRRLMSTSCSSLSGSLMGERLRGTFCMTVCGREGEKIMRYTTAHAGHTLPVQLHTQLHLCLCVSDGHLMCFQRLSRMCLCVDACLFSCFCAGV